MWKYTELAYLLANLFFKQDDFIGIAITAGYSPGLLTITNSAINNWIFLLHDAEDEGKIKEILRASLVKKPANQYLQSMLDNEPAALRTSLARRDLAWMNPDGARHKEALTRTQDSLLPISFLELGMRKARCVVYIKTPDSLGTGFVIRNNFLITNNHVIDSEQTAADTTVVFHYERRSNGGFRKLVNVRLDPQKGFKTCKNTDWTIVKLKTNPLKPLDYLTFAENPAKAEDFVNIIQHPGGDEKKIGIYHNLVTYADAGILQYLTDTQEGSSGSPVFNSSWEVVALHHSSVRLDNSEAGDELRNEGSAIEVVQQEIKKAIPEIEF